MNTRVFCRVVDIIVREVDPRVVRLDLRRTVRFAGRKVRSTRVAQLDLLAGRFLHVGSL